MNRRNFLGLAIGAPFLGLLQIPEKGLTPGNIREAFRKLPDSGFKHSVSFQVYDTQCKDLDLLNGNCCAVIEDRAGRIFLFNKEDIQVEVKDQTIVQLKLTDDARA